MKIGDHKLELEELRWYMIQLEERARKRRQNGHGSENMTTRAIEEKIEECRRELEALDDTGTE